ncbi:MAG: ribosomal RNA small subunit methyltransferase A [Rickettsiales bacterium]|nr:ribosomal RNA small subunit methyltransferase A [Rickettsiales bacterium]|tara:strand:- start:20128 stop:20943 length:816 start_codon:yes stop_codon:yes gene_type:complete
MVAFDYSWIRQFEAKKSLGQNFLIDPNHQRNIVQSMNYTCDDVIVEVGPGLGALTHLLIQQDAQKVIVVEKDPRFCEHLENVFGHVSNKLEIIQADALTVDWQKLIDKPYKLISNLPYNISTPIILNLIKSAHINEMVLMVQKEVAKRIVAKPDSKIYGRLSILPQWLYNCKDLFDVGSSSFRPQPRVKSSVVHLKRKDLNIPPDAFEKVEKFTQLIFHQRRKMMKSILKSKIENPEIFLTDHGVDPTSRPESLAIETIVSLAHDYGVLKQ